MGRQLTGWITHRATRWIALVVTLALTLGLASFASKLGDVQENDLAAFLPSDAESTQLAERAAEFAPDDEITGIAVYEREGGVVADDLTRVLADWQALSAVPDVQGVFAPALAAIPEDQLAALQADPAAATDEQLAALTSDDGEAVQLVVTLRLDDADGFNTLPDVVSDMRDIVERDTAGLQGYLGGPLSFASDQAEAFGGVDGILLLAALGVVIVMLLLTYRSPILWLVPLICGVLSIGAAEGLVYLLADNAGLTVNGQSAGILAVLVLGASIDYALLLVARYREELRNFESRFDAMAHALHRAAPAILASGATVIIGLLCLALAELNSTAGLGPVIAAGIAAALFVMLVLLPLFLVALGRWVFWPFIPRFGDPKPEERGFWSRVGRRVAKRPRPVWVGTLALLGAACVGLVQLDAGLLSNEDQFTTEQKSTIADEVIAEHFPAGQGAPLQVIANTERADEVVAILDDLDGLQPSTGADDATGGGVTLGDLTYVERTLLPASDTIEAQQVVRDARAAVGAVDGADALVGGQTAIIMDVNDAAERDNQLIIPLVLVVVLLILAVLLRSILAPVLLLGTVVLSFGAALGISALVFQYGFGWDGVDTAFPLFTFVFLVALGIDYNIFLMTRVREEALKLGTRRGALVGLAATGGVITSAGLVLAGTFSALATLPIIFLAQLGFTVALGVLLDTLIVRSILVTALTLDIGRWMWWPSRLWRTDGGVESTDDRRAVDATG